LAVIAVIGLFGANMTNKAMNVDSGSFLQELESRAHKHVPHFKQAIAESLERITPIAQEAFARKAEKLGPRLDAKLNAEAIAFKATAESLFERAMESAFTEHELKQRAVVVRHIPELKGDVVAQQNVIDTVRAGVIKWGARQYAGMMNEHVAALDDIRSTLNRGFRAPVGQGTTDPQDVVMLWLELVNETIGTDNTILGDPETDQAANERKSSRTLAMK
jgi:hypothetical protein